MRRDESRRGRRERLRHGGIAALVGAVIMVSCSQKNSGPEFQKFADEFVYTTLSFSPVNASGQGLHKYNGVDFDRDLDDVSMRAVQKQRDYYIAAHKQLEAFDKSSLSSEDRADYDVIDTAIGLALFDMDIAQSWRHSPQSYVELLGSALFIRLCWTMRRRKNGIRTSSCGCRKFRSFSRRRSTS